MSPFSHVIISASAGTGKTFQLSNRFLQLLCEEVAPDQILATTFTRKAAGEILDRVVLRLADAALDAGKRSSLSEQLGVPSLTQARCYELLGRVLRHLHRLRISTLDAFFAQLAGSFSLELGLPPGWKIIEDLHEKYLRSEAIERTLHADQTHDIQRLVHLMTKGEAQRSVSELVRSTVDNLYSLYMETDAQAWQQIPQPRLLTQERLAELCQQLRDMTLPADKRFAKAREDNLTAVAEGDWESFLAKGLAGKIIKEETTFYSKPIPDDVVALYRRLFDHVQGVYLQQIRAQMEGTHAMLDRFHATYSQIKQETGALRFEDITRVLANGERAAGIEQARFRLDSPIAHLLLDEFQDTSLPQWQVIRPLAQFVTAQFGTGPEGSSPRRGSGQKSFFCVGDAKQAIYAWRGGKSEIFEALDSDLGQLTKQPLNRSYRSSQPVIDVVNRVFRDMIRHDNLDRLEPAVQEWSARFPEHTTALTELPGYVELRTAPEAGEGENATDVKLAWTAERVKELIRLAPGHSIGILTRRNDTVTQLIHELRQRDVPASEEGGGHLNDSPATQVILSLLKLADHPRDTVARFHVAQSPLAHIVGYDDFRDELQTLKLSRAVRTQLLGDGYGPTLRRWAEPLAAYCDRREWTRLHQLVETGYAYEPLATLRPTDFVRYVELKRVTDPTAADVRVMTVHQSKGLQFDLVVLADLDAALIGQPESFVTGQPSPTAPIDCVCLYRNSDIQRLLPQRLRKLFEDETRSSVFEAMCVLYVALTRAVHALHMFIAPSDKGTLPKTAAGLLRAALTDGRATDADQCVFATGDPQWYARHRQPPKPLSSPVESSAESPRHEPIRLAPPLPDAHPEWTAPSQLEGGAKIRVRHVLDLSGSVATTRGTLIHALFEQVRWLEDGLPVPEVLQRIAESLCDEGINPTEQVAAFRRMLEFPAVARVLSRSFYESPTDDGVQRAIAAGGGGASLRAEVRNERRFAVRDKARLLCGSIDRLVLVYDGDRVIAADVLDFKTDAANSPEKLSELVDHYRPQLEAYCQAVANMYRLSAAQITARLLFVSSGEVRSVRG